MTRLFIPNSLARVARVSLSLSLLVAAGLFVGPKTWSQTDGDRDGDGVPDVVDNCTLVANPDQRDTDGDGIGNACDGDLDNNGIVNSLDYTLFKNRLLSKDPDADLDGNGVVNSLDFTIFKTMLLKPAGPSAVSIDFSAPALDFAKNPPPALRAEQFALPAGGKLGPGGRDGVMLLEFTGETRKQFALKQTIIVRPGGGGDVLNDLGIEPDLKANDNVFTGFVKLTETPEKALADLRRLQAKLPNARDPRTGIFRGRELLDVVRPREFTIKTPVSPLPGLVAFPFPDINILLPFLGDENRSLAITDLSVIADPARTFDMCDTDGDGSLGNANGPWSFKTLMTNMANSAVTGVSPKEFVHAWLRRWMVNNTVNSFNVPNRAAGMQSQILDNLVGWDPVNPATLNMDSLPFRLLAILYRPDLGSSSSPYGGKSKSPSEIRFVFGLLRKVGATCQPNQSGMTVIFEFGDRDTCTGLKQRAQQWLSLDEDHPPFPAPSFNIALQAITDDVTKANAQPAKPNGSALNQLRTNDIALGLGAPWELREFHLDPATHQLEPSPLAQTPASSFNMTPRLAACINDANCRQTVPLTHTAPGFPATPFLAGSQTYSQFFNFDAPSGTVGVNNNRRLLSENTCGGCHGANALNPAVPLGAGGLNVVPPFPASLGSAPESFYHVDPRTPGGTRARLSRFMRGTDTNAPNTNIPDATQFGGSTALGAKKFDDLLRRGNIMQTQATASCFFFPNLPVLIEQINLPIVH